MAMTLDGTSGLFARVGAYYKALTNAEAVSGISEEERAYQVQRIREAAQRYLISYVQADTQSPHTLESALNEVVIQAMEQTESCDASSAVGTNYTTTYIGSGIALFSTGNAKAKYNLDSGGARDFLATWRCIVVPVNAPNHQALWSFVSEPVNDPLSPTWMRGLGYNTTLRPLSAQVDAQPNVQNQTILVNGGMERFTSNAPDQFTVDTGTPGTHLDDTTDKYIGTNALVFTGQGSANLTKIYQTLGDASGSPVTLLPQTTYYIGARMKASASSTGVVRLSIEDSSGTEKYSSGLAKDVSTLGTSYENVGGIFYTGDAMSSTNRFVVELTTTLNNTKVLTMDEFVLAPCFIVPGTLRVTLLETDTAPELNDRILLNRNVTRDHLQITAWERLFGMQLFDLAMPEKTDGTETIADSLSVTTPT